MGRIPKQAEDAWIRLFEDVVHTKALRQHRFDFLRGDPTPKFPQGNPLPVGAYFPGLRLVVEYMGSRHFKPHRYFDRRPGRREQRNRYQILREERLRERGFTLIRIANDDAVSEATVRTKLAAAGQLQYSAGAGHADCVEPTGVWMVGVLLVSLAVLFVVIVGSGSPAPAQGQEAISVHAQATSACLSTEDVNTLLAEKWQHALVDRFGIAESACVSRIGENAVEYILTGGKRVSVHRLGTKEQGHWVRIRGRGQGVFRFSDGKERPVLWVDLFRTPTEILAMIKYDPPSEWGRVILNHRINLLTSAGDGKPWTVLGSVDYAQPYPKRNTNGTVQTGPLISSHLFASRDHAVTFSQRYAPVLMDCVESSCFEAVR